MLVRSTIVLVLLLTGSFQSAPDLLVTVSGRITDSWRGMPLPYTEVHLLNENGNEWRVQSDSNGVYTIEGVPSEAYVLKVFCMGYKMVVKDVRVSEKNRTFDVRLKQTITHEGELIGTREFLVLLSPLSHVNASVESNGDLVFRYAFPHDHVDPCSNEAASEVLNFYMRIRLVHADMQACADANGHTLYDEDGNIATGAEIFDYPCDGVRVSAGDGLCGSDWFYISLDESTTVFAEHRWVPLFRSSRTRRMFLERYGVISPDDSRIERDRILRSVQRRPSH